MKTFTHEELALMNRYQLVPRTLVFIRHEGKIVLIEKNKNNSLVQGQFNGVGGHVEMGEEPVESAIREVREETGLQVTGLQMVAILFIDTGINPGIMVFVFKADSAGGTITESGEGRLVLLTRDEVNHEKRMMQDIPALLEICENHKTNHPPKILKYFFNKNGVLRIVINS